MPPKENLFFTAFKDLPAIDFDRARQMLEAGDLSVPASWPVNWPWLLAMRDAILKIQQHEQKAVALRHSVWAFREMFLRGDEWPTAPEARQRTETLADALIEAKLLIKALRSGLHPDGWDEYESQSGTMRIINEALALAEKES